MTVETLPFLPFGLLAAAAIMILLYITYHVIRAALLGLLAIDEAIFWARVASGRPPKPWRVDGLERRQENFPHYRIEEQ